MRFLWVFVLAAFGSLGLSSAAEGCGEIKTFADGRIPLREIFVSSSSESESGDGTRDKPYASLRRALEGIHPGDAIRLLPGKYRAGISLEDIHGEESAPIWIGGVAGGERPVIEGGGSGLRLRRVRYLVLENLEVAGATGNGINCDDGAEYANENATRHVIFRNLKIHSIGRGRNNDGLKLSGVYDFFVMNCNFERISRDGSAIDHVGCHRGVIANSTFAQTGNSVQCKGGSEDIEIRACRFSDVQGRAINIGGSTGFEFFRPPLSTNAPNFEGKNIRVFGNVFERCESPVAFVGAIDSIAAQNTFIDPTDWVVRILQETVSQAPFRFLPCGQNEFSSNLIYYQRSRLRTQVNVGAYTDATSFIFGNNLWFAHDAPTRSAPSLPVPESASVIGEDPKFKNAATGDYQLASGSPAAGKGKKLPSVRADHSGHCYNDPPSIGAFEIE